MKQAMGKEVLIVPFDGPQRVIAEAKRFQSTFEEETDDGSSAYCLARWGSELVGRLADQVATMVVPEPLVGTFACPVCGVATPHSHHVRDERLLDETGALFVRINAILEDAAHYGLGEHEPLRATFSDLRALIKIAAGHVAVKGLER